MKALDTLWNVKVQRIQRTWSPYLDAEEPTELKLRIPFWNIILHFIRLFKIFQLFRGQNSNSSLWHVRSSTNYSYLPLSSFGNFPQALLLTPFCNTAILPSACLNRLIPRCIYVSLAGKDLVSNLGTKGKSSISPHSSTSVGWFLFAPSQMCLF